MRADWDLAAARRLRQHVRTWRPDVVHAHDARAHALALAALLGQREIPLIVTRRVTFTPRGRLKYGARVRRFIAISNAVKRALVAGGVGEHRIDVVYSGVPAPHVDSPRDWRRELGWGPATATVLCGVVGAMTAEKGVDTLAEIARLLDADARRQCRLVLLGGQAQGFTDLAGVPTFRAGFVDEIHRAMAGLDLLWHPSQAEGLGTSVIDAMALGVPPVTYGIGGLGELIHDRVNGVLVSQVDPGEFAQAVSALIADADLRQRLAAAGPIRAREFSVDRMVDGTQRVYESVLG
jgi:glycosyltransferase involved in cell wall biosynthesis